MMAERPRLRHFPESAANRTFCGHHGIIEIEPEAELGACRLLTRLAYNTLQSSMGVPLIMSGQAPRRRLAAILAADVVGYSRLMQADEAGTLAALKSRRAEILQPLVAKYHGRLVRLMGDGVLVEFASAVDAVTCAMELQDAMAMANAGLREDRHIILRVGINLGDVMVEGSDLYGDGVNIAALLEAFAKRQDGDGRLVGKG